MVQGFNALVPPKGTRPPAATRYRNPDLDTFVTQTNAHRVLIAVYPDSNVASMESVTPTMGNASVLQDGAGSIALCLVRYLLLLLSSTLTCHRVRLACRR
jgi:hypothetical protein